MCIVANTDVNLISVHELCIRQQHLRLAFHQHMRLVCTHTSIPRLTHTTTPSRLHCHSPDIGEVLRLLGRLGDEALTHGAYEARATACFRAIFEVDEFVKNGSLLRHLKVNPSSDAAVAWFLLRLAIHDESADVREHPEMHALVRYISHSNQPGAAVISKKLDMVFASGSGAAKAAAAAVEAASLDDAMSIVPPGQREHDNDWADFRDISIYPTASELMSTESPYLPYV